MTNIQQIEELYKKKEDLLPELEYHLTESHFGICIKHPLIFCIPYSHELNAITNFQYNKKRELLNNYLKDKDYMGSVFIYEKPYRFFALTLYESLINDKEYWSILGEVWSNTENLWQCKKYIRKLMYSKNHSIEYRELFMDEESRNEFHRLKLYNKTVTIYRGCKSHNQLSWSWTFSPTKAKWFAKRLPFDKKEKCYILETEININQAFAFMNSRSENEIIIDPVLIKKENIKYTLIN